VKMIEHLVAVCPCCGDFVKSLDEFTGWCRTCTRELRENA
jgi:predicted amidophosphoribosyltransferase